MSAAETSSNAIPGFSPFHQSIVKPLRPKALREIVFETLLYAIVHGEIKSGDWLNHQHLAERFQVSATPVREALQNLASFGIVENQHNRGTVVRPFGPKQVEDIFYVRALLEAEATRLACGEINLIRLDEIKSKTSELLSHESPDWITEVPTVDKGLHELIAEACGKSRLKEEIYRYHVFIFIPRTFQLKPYRQVLAEHLLIIDKLLAKNPTQAAQAMIDHIHSGAKTCNSLLFPEKR
jgi:DNA-binding GntR family transcriptional regulator